MGGVLEVAEIPGFLGNLNELYAAADSDGQMWREFTGAWWEAYREEPKRVSELNQFCEDRDLMLSVRGDGRRAPNRRGWERRSASSATGYSTGLPSNGSAKAITRPAFCMCSCRRMAINRVGILAEPEPPGFARWGR